MSHDRRELIGLIANAGVMGDSNPPASRNFGKPFFIRVIVRKVIGMTLNGEAGVTERGRELQP